MLRAKVEIEIENTITFFILYKEVKVTVGSSNIGAYVRFFAMLTKEDLNKFKMYSALKSYIGREMFIIPLPLKILFPSFVKTSFNIFFCRLMTS